MPRTLTPDQVYDRKVKAIDRKYARVQAQMQKENARRMLAAQIGRGITEMALRHATSMHRQMAAFMSANQTYCGKSEQHWERITNRQYKALCRLTYALRDLAEKGV